MIDKNELIDGLHGGVARVVRAWAKGQAFTCTPEPQPDGSLILTLRRRDVPVEEIEKGDWMVSDIPDDVLEKMFEPAGA